MKIFLFFFLLISQNAYPFIFRAGTEAFAAISYAVFFFFFPLLWKAFMKPFPAADFGCTDVQEEGELIHQPCVRDT